MGAVESSRCARHRRHAGDRRGHRPRVPALRRAGARLRADRARRASVRRGPHRGLRQGGYQGPGAGGRGRSACCRSVRAAGRRGEQRGRVAVRGRGDRVPPVPRQGDRAEPDRAAAHRAGRQRGDAGPGRRIDHHGRQRERCPAVAGHGRVRRRQGGPAPPGHQPRHRVGSRGQDQLRRAGLRGDRGGRPSSTATRTRSPPSPRPCRCAGSRRRTTWPRRACSWRLPVPPTSAGRASRCTAAASLPRSSALV